MPVSRLLLIDLSKLNGMPTHHERYPIQKKRITDGIPTDADVEWLVDGVDAVFLCETPLNFYLYEYAKEKNVIVVNQFNYEFLDHLKDPYKPRPDILAAPTYWGVNHVKKLGIAQVEVWPVPISEIHLRQLGIKPFSTFIHIVGRPAAQDRNGTIAFLTAAVKLGKQYKYKIFVQTPAEPKTCEAWKPLNEAIIAAKMILGDNLEVVENLEDNSEMYQSGEILVLPRKYGGLCLPMLEALSWGLPVIMPNITPNKQQLPTEWLVEAKIAGTFQTQTEIILYDVFVEDLISKMRYVAENLYEANKKAGYLARARTWGVMRELYLKRLYKICKK